MSDDIQQVADALRAAVTSREEDLYSVLYTLDLISPQETTLFMAFDNVPLLVARCTEAAADALHRETSAGRMQLSPYVRETDYLALAPVIPYAGSRIVTRMNHVQLRAMISADPGRYTQGNDFTVPLRIRAVDPNDETKKRDTPRWTPHRVSEGRGSGSNRQHCVGAVNWP